MLYGERIASEPHCLFLDGVYVTTEEGPVFQAVRAPTAEQLHTRYCQVELGLRVRSIIAR